MAKELRVAWIADIFDEVSGIITDTEEMHRQAQKNNVFWQPVTCYTSPIEPFHVFKPLMRISTDSFYSGTSFYVPNVVNVLAYLIRNKINIIVSNTPGLMGIVAMTSAAYLRLPWVDIYHTDIDYYANSLSGGFFLGNPLIKPIFNRAGLFYLKQYQKQADLIFVRTKEFHERLTQKGHDPKKLRPYPAGINIEHWNPKFRSREYWRSVGVDPDKRIILFVGRITKVKDIVFLLEFFDKEKPEGCELVLVGSGPEKEEYENKYRGNKQVHFLGVKKGLDLQTIYASADLYVLPSGSETLGKTVLEAMSSGTPVLISNRGGPQEYVAAEKNGCIFKAGDYTSFKNTLLGMLSSPKRMEDLKNNARDSILSFTDKKLFDQFTSHLKSLV